MFRVAIVCHFFFKFTLYSLDFLKINKKITKLYNNTIHLNKLLYAKQVLLMSENMYRISMNKSGKKIAITPPTPKSITFY